MPARQRAEKETISTTSHRSQPFFISFFVCLTDQVAKLLVVRSFVPGESRAVIPPVFHLTYVQNIGAAFGLFKGQQWLFLVCSLLVSGWIIRELVQPRKLPALTAAAYALVLGGAFGNLIDRVRLGYVIDFLDFRVWPVFNVGDSAITIGVTFLIWQALFSQSKP